MAQRKKKEEDKAYGLYMTTDMGLKEISEIVGVSYDTAARWASDGKWKEQKSANSLTKEKIIKNTLVHISNLQEEINGRDKKFPDSKEQDIMVKASQLIKSLSARTSLPDYFNVLNEFLKTLGGDDVELAKKIAPKVKGFLQHKTRELDE